MGDVISLAESLHEVSGDDDVSREKFLLDEGLELLAAYRSIEDVELRRSLFQLVKAVAGKIAKTAE